jgi:Mn2+/Fe2+ NRAMP family transporter
MGRYIALIAAIALPFFVLHAAVPVLVTAYKTGKLAARGATYDRTQHPLLFWFGIAFWIFLIAFSIFFAVGFTMAGLAPAPESARTRLPLAAPAGAGA